MLGVFVLSGGEDNLSFRVLDGTSAPASPKERDIWVNTTTAITSWDFSPTQPLRRSSNANLLVSPYASGASLVTHGITFTCDSSGHVTVSGTATANAYYRVHNDTAGVMYLEPGTYTLSGCPEQPNSGNSYFLNLYDIDNERTLGSDYGSGVSVTLTRRTHVRVNICVWNEKTASSAVFKPKLEKAAVATSYVKGDATGQVWFKTGDTGDASLNALDENGIWLNISGARQYVDGAWAETETKIYLNGAWLELRHYLSLFGDGKDNTTVTGGWTANGQNISNSNLSVVGGNLQFTHTSNGTNDNGQWVVSPANKIDVTKYSKMSITFASSTIDSGNLCLAKSQDWSTMNGYQDGAAAVLEMSSIGPNKIYEIDISAVTGEWFVGVTFYEATNENHTVQISDWKLIP